MRFNDAIDLGTDTITYGDLGVPTVTMSWTTVMANRMSVGAREFYNAALTGLRPSAMFQIRTIEYGGQRKLKHNNEEMNIIRVETKGDFTVLVCEKVGANA